MESKNKVSQFFDALKSWAVGSAASGMAVYYIICSDKVKAQLTEAFGSKEYAYMVGIWIVFECLLIFWAGKDVVKVFLIFKNISFIDKSDPKNPE